MTNALDPHPLVWESRVRGCLLGLALGESLAFQPTELSEPSEPSGLIQAGPATQLAAFTVEGVVRAAVRSLQQGSCHPPSVVWAAYCRWGQLQGLLPEDAAELDGWLVTVPTLRERRGAAEATVTAIQDTGPGTRDAPTTGSMDWQALVRGLPFAALSGQAHWSDVLMATECAALTHGHPRAWSTAAAGARLLNNVLAARTGREDLPAVITEALPGLDEELAAGLRTALWAASTRPGERDVLYSLASNDSAASVLMGGVYAATSFPGREGIYQAMRFAATAPEAHGVSAMTGAVIGSLHGVEIWPAGVLARHELVWVLDTLARDLVRQLTANPGGSAKAAPHDPRWNERYPGW
ncbi:ADP-ribosylglycohydrolase family protein [Kineosporia rhizophila]|uniref:ADP-ribosylglycohydrolase family protein n=1 Tax=Kineosporia rhizophila TaxID=84633 RepID=UPI001E44F8EC|nr:ADP-ribosylglycohydrolase family protein [Kineosporia rhizophila]